MGELSDFRSVEDAAELAEQPATNGRHVTNGANGHSSAIHSAATPGARNGYSVSMPGQEASIEANGDVDAAGGVEFAKSSGATQPELHIPHRDTWGPAIPSLRIGQVGAAGSYASIEAPATLPAVAVAAAPTHVYDPHARPPLALRPMRLVFGLVLLLSAWLATVGVLMLGRSLLAGLPEGMELPFQLGLYTLTALGALWLLVVALACLAAGAFALSLALTTRRW